jgi:hypothetical protein
MITNRDNLRNEIDSFKEVLKQKDEFFQTLSGAKLAAENHLLLMRGLS